MHAKFMKATLSENGKKSMIFEFRLSTVVKLIFAGVNLKKFR